MSRQAPGKRDKKSVKDPITGKRSLIQIRHILVTIGEAFEMFKLEYGNSVISKSKFYKLRPEIILPVSQMPHNVCLCKYHYKTFLYFWFNCQANSKPRFSIKLSWFTWWNVLWHIQRKMHDKSVQNMLYWHICFDFLVLSWSKCYH